ncbi:TPA: TetR/AcrR family transcriptional regulator, partial [Corynebacterium striatum]|nr:TetR/AcrR family transcriptional regulator [Corynebacterium striatum]
LIFLDGGMAGARLTRELSPLKTARELAIQLLSEPPADYSI